MKRLLSLILTLFLLTNLLSFSSFAETKSEKSTGLAQSLPLEEYPIGSYFTKNGKRCTCHNSSNCIASGTSCNCMRFWPTGRASTCEIDLLGVQCIGFARFCQYRLFGFIDYGDTAYRFQNLLGRSLSAGNWSAADAERYIKQAGVGGHIRISTHSIVIVEIRNDGFTTYECNGKTSGSECKVYSRSFTWKSFYQAYGNTTWRYLNMPKSEYLPTEPTPDTTPPVTTEAPVTTTAPVTTAAPITTEAPATTEAPVTALPPEMTEAPPAGSEPPDAEMPLPPDSTEESTSAYTDMPADNPISFPIPKATLTADWFACRRMATYSALPPPLPHPLFRRRSR